VERLSFIKVIQYLRKISEIFNNAKILVGSQNISENVDRRRSSWKMLIMLDILDQLSCILLARRPSSRVT
jgi:hypothetical protein